MKDVIVIGDGPGGLSAALFLAKSGKSVTVFGTDQTAMHAAMLHNYLGIPHISGSDFQVIARDQVTSFGAELVHAEVSTIRKLEEGFEVVLADGSTQRGRYLILTEGKKPALAESLGLPSPRTGVPVDSNGRTEIDGVYAVGRTVRRGRSQAIISAGDGAAAALDILARIKGAQAFYDWDVPEKDA